MSAIPKPKADANPIEMEKWFSFGRKGQPSPFTDPAVVQRPLSPTELGLIDASPAFATAQPAKTLALPFTVRVARTPDKVRKALDVRHRSYSFHYPWLGESLNTDEDEDYADNSIILLCESKEDGEALGSVRIQTNVAGQLKTKMPFFLPESYAADSIGFVSRLSVIRHRHGRLVKLALFKAIYQYCCALQIKWMVTAAIEQTAPIYLQLGFAEAFEDRRRYVGQTGVAGIYVFDVMCAESRWREQGHPYYNFVFQTTVADIRVFDSVAGAWARPRSRKAPRQNNPNELGSACSPTG